MIDKIVQYFGKPLRVACDERCDKAWGINNRPKVQLSDDIDDYAFLADDELGMAPDDPGTYEGGQGKPTISAYPAPNKWCVRECERCARLDICAPLELPDFSVRRYNKRESSHA